MSVWKSAVTGLGRRTSIFISNALAKPVWPSVSPRQLVETITWPYPHAPPYTVQSNSKGPIILLCTLTQRLYNKRVSIIMISILWNCWTCEVWKDFRIIFAAFTKDYWNDFYIIYRHGVECQIPSSPSSLCVLWWKRCANMLWNAIVGIAPLADFDRATISISWNNESLASETMLNN